MIMNLFPQRGATLLRNARSLFAISSIALIAGCGGGGGGDGDSAINPSQSPTANAKLSFNSVTFNSGSVATTYEATGVMVDYGARVHLADVGPFPDSPGQGTTIMVIDDFKGVRASTNLFPLINRSINAHTTSSSIADRYSATYSIRYQVDTPITHGDLVSSIAGGYSKAVTSPLTLKVPAGNTADLVSCKLSFEAKQLSCPTAFHTNAPASTLMANLNLSPIPGVASEATMLRSPVDLSASQTALTTTASIYGHLLNSLTSQPVNVINLSLGADMGVSNDILKDVQALVNTYPIPNPAKAVITISAGNSSTPCSAEYFGCNTMAMAMALQNTTTNSTIVVGALTGTGILEMIADYSTRPGDLAFRFIYASGDTGFYGDAKGTSFAAPRVAGVAAIIKQKFPKLTSDQIANIILDSADNDINNDGIPEFVITPPAVSDPIYGRGKLSLKNALALAATY
jgi:subtilisin family serine protease